MTKYTRAAWPKDGATIAEAFERTSLPEFDLEPWLRTSGPADRSAEKRVDAGPAAWAAFFRFLRDGRLIATGHGSEAQDDKPLVIEPAAWDSLELIPGKNCVKGSKGLARHGLRIFPLLSSPVAAQRIASLSLKDVFERFIANDPEFLAAGMRNGSDRRRALGHVLGSEHPVFGRFGCFWQVMAKALDGSNSPIGFLSAEERDSARREAHDVARDRMAALFELLRRAVIVANGHGRDGDRVDISSGLWQSSRCYVDFETGEFLELDTKDKPHLKVSGIMLSASAVADSGAKDSGPRLRSGETAKVFAKRFFNEEPEPERRYAEAGGIEAFCEMVSDNSNGALSASAIGKELRAEARAREMSRATNVTPIYGK